MTIKEQIEDLAKNAEALRKSEAALRKSANKLAIMWGVKIPTNMQQVVMLAERAVMLNEEPDATNAEVLANEPQESLIQ